MSSVIPASNLTPGTFVQLSFGAGRTVGALGAKRVLLMGNKTSAGSQAVNEAVLVSDEDDGIASFGPGSELDRMIATALDAYPGALLYAIAIAEAGTAATGAITVEDTATADGTLVVTINGEAVNVDIASGDTHTAVSNAIVAAINAQTRLPVTAAAAGTTTRTVTITAKNTGPRGNELDVQSVLTGGAGLTFGLLNGSLTSGATLDSPTAALAAIAGTRYEYIVSPYSSDAEIGEYEAHVDEQAAPLQGNRQRYFHGFRGTVANAVTLSAAINAFRGQLVLEQGSFDTNAQIAARAAASHALWLDGNPQRNVDGFTLAGGRPPRLAADRLTASEVNTCLLNGITPTIAAGTELRIARSVTNYHLDASGNPTVAVLDVSKVEVPDFIADSLESDFAAAFAGFLLDEDPPAGTAPEPETVTPSSARDLIADRLSFHGAGGGGQLMLQNVPALVEATTVTINANVPGRLDSLVPLDVVEGAHQFGIDVRQIG
jgi:phage tail sheath gpL-like